MIESDKEPVTKKEKVEVDIKIPLIFSFVLLAIFMSIGLSSDKYRFWGIQEQIIGVGEIGLIGVLAYHLTLLLMIFVFIFFGYSKWIHWVSLIIIFSCLGYFALNSGFCMTEKGIYERNVGITVYYSFKEIKEYELTINKKTNKEKPYHYMIALKNGKEFVFEQQKANPELILKLNQSVFVAEKE